MKEKKLVLLCLLLGIAVLGSYSLSWGLTTPGIGTTNQVTPDGTSNVQGAWLGNMSLVYHNCTDDTIRKIGADGLGDTNLSDPSDMYYCDSKPVVGPEGNWIVFQRNIDGSGAGVWVMDTNGLNQRAIVPYDAVSGIGATWPSISPDGNQVAYRCSAPGHGSIDLCVAPFAGGTPTQLTIGGLYPHHGIGWLSTGGVRRSTRSITQVLTSLEHYVPPPIDDWTRDVAKVTTNPGTITYLGNPNDDYCTLFPKVDPLGKVVYQDDQAGDGDVMLMNADGTNKVRLTNAAATGACSNHPEPHPGGQYFAFWSNLNDTMDGTLGCLFRVWIMTRDGRFMAPLMTAADCRANCWSWGRYNLEFSPDGSSLLFMGIQSADDGATCGSYYQIHVIALDTGDADGDRLLNWQEVVYGTNPLNPDTDGGGEIDGSEALYGKDPTNPADDLQSSPTRRTR